MLLMRMLLQLLRRAFTYNWRLWSVADVAELLREAGFSHVAVWVKQLQVRQGGCRACMAQGGALWCWIALGSSSSSSSSGSKRALLAAVYAQKQALPSGISCWASCKVIQ
jgi:hypothetical protein